MSAPTTPVAPGLLAGLSAPSAVTTDPVIERHELALKRAREVYDNAARRRDACAEAVTDARGRPRPSFVAELSERDANVAACAHNVATAEAALAAAIDDLPRRDALRAVADALEAEAVEFDADAAELRDRLATVEANAAARRDRAAEARGLASRTADEIAARAKPPVVKRATPPDSLVLPGTVTFGAVPPPEWAAS
jgi:hypothetical protein